MKIILEFASQSVELDGTMLVSGEDGGREVGGGRWVYHRGGRWV